MSVKDYSTNANNNGSKPGINFAEGQVPSSLNDSARVVMADIAEWYAQISAGTVSGAVGGTGNAITLTTAPTVGAYATNQRYLVKAPGGNTVNNPTLNVSGLGVRTIVGPGGAALAIPSYQVDDMLLLSYDGTSFRLMSPASLPAATVAEVLIGTDTTKMVTSDTLAGLWQRGADIASASTLTLPAAGGGVFTVTGTTTVTGISSAYGGRRVALRFAGALTLTHNGTSLILPGAVNITTAAGDVAEFVNDAAQDATGSNWRCVSYLRASGAHSHAINLPLVTATGNYTATTANAGGFVYFGSLTAAATLSLPSAASMAGQSITVVNSSTDFAVIIDPSGAELLDGAATRQTFGTSRITIISDGAQWLTVQGRYLYFTGDQTWPAATAASTNFTHGLGIRPQKVWAELRCAVADAGYAVGDTIVAHAAVESSSTTLGMTVVYDATNLRFVVANTQSVYIMPKGGGSNALATTGSWRYRIYAEAY